MTLRLIHLSNAYQGTIPQVVLTDYPVITKSSQLQSREKSGQAFPHQLGHTCRQIVLAGNPFHLFPHQPLPQ